MPLWTDDMTLVLQGPRGLDGDPGPQGVAGAIVSLTLGFIDWLAYERTVNFLQIKIILKVESEKKKLLFDSILM